jgi:hypothetical protein
LLLAAYRPMMTHASSGSHPASFAVKKHPVAISSSATHFTLQQRRIVVLWCKAGELWSMVCKL